MNRDELIAKLEAAEGPCRELDWAIAVSVGRKDEADKPGIWAGVDQMAFVEGLSRFTASIDAALTLVPEGKVEEVFYEAMMLCGQAKADFAKDLPHFICIAALRAQQEGEGHE